MMNIDKQDSFIKDVLSQEELIEIRGGQIDDDAGWVTSISGECSNSGESCWTMQGIGDWITGR